MMIDGSLGGFRLVLEAAYNRLAVSHVPFLYEAISGALRILNIVQDVKSQNQALNDLASDACGIVYTIVIQCQDMKKAERAVPDRLQIHIAHLARNLATIEKFARKKVDRASLKRFILRSKDFEEIKRYRNLLKQSLEVFGVQANMTIQSNLQHILNDCERQDEKTEGHFEKREDEQRRAEQELASQLEILRIQQEDQQAEMEELLRKECEDLERRIRREERKRREQAGDGKDPDTTKIPEADNKSQSRQKRPQGPYCYQFPAGSFYQSYSYPSPPYIHPPFFGSSYTERAFHGIPIPSVMNTASSAISATNSCLHITSYNSGNVTNCVIKNSMNSYGPKKKSTNAKTSLHSDYDSESDISTLDGYEE